MPRRPATITQADVARTIRAAKQAGAGGVEIRPDGTLLVHFRELPIASLPAADEEPVWPADCVP